MPSIIVIIPVCSCYATGLKLLVVHEYLQKFYHSLLANRCNLYVGTGSGHKATESLLQVDRVAYHTLTTHAHVDDK